MMRAKIFAIFISVTVTLAAAEIFVRAAGLWKEMGPNDHGDMQSFPDGGYSFKPGLNRRWSGARWHTNSLGLRSAWEPSQMKSDCRKILFVGGSITAGYGVDDSDAYPQQLQTLLNREPSCFQIINAAQPAYNAEDVTWMLKRMLPLYKPDLVIWVANPFAMNGRSFVTPDGNLRSQPMDNALADTLVLFWKSRGRFLDLTRPYTPPPEENSRLQASWAYRYFKPFWDQHFGEASACPSDNCLDLRPPGLPRYAATSLSPVQQQRFYAAANEAVAAARAAGAAIMLMTIDIFIEPERLLGSPRLLDLSEVTGIPTPRLFENYNLRWDFHLNRRGNALVAEGLKNFLLSSPEKSATGGPTLRFIEDNRKVQARYREQIASAVEPAAFKNVHQIVSGLKPDPRFSEQNVALILKKTEGQGELVIRGENFAEAPKKFGLQFPATSMKPAELMIAPGPFEIRHPAPDIASGIVDLRWTCLEESCDYLRYDFIGWEQSRE